jgi:acetyl esterase/lipase
MKSRILFLTLLAFGAFGQAQKPLQLSDILSWKRVQAPVVSANGEWFAYRIAPAEGNAEVVVRNLKTGKEERYPAGDRTASSPAPAGGGAPGRGAAAAGAAAGGPEFSEDSKWVVFSAYPLTRDAKRMKAQRRTIHPKAVLVELATGKKVEFEKVRRFAFSGEKSSVLAVHRFGADAPAGGGNAAAPPAGGATPPERPTGSDLLLYDLAGGNEMNVGNVSEFAFNKKGDALAWIIDAQDKAGNGVALENLDSGQVLPLESGTAVYKSLAWTEKGDAFTALKGVEDKGFEDKLYSVVAFKDLHAAKPTKVVFDPKDDKSFPAGMTVASARAAAWRQDLSGLVFGLHEVKPKKPGARDAAPTEGDTAAAPPRPAPPEEDKPSLVLWHYKDPRLQSQQQVQETADKNFSFLAAYFPGQKKFVRLADESLRQVSVNPEQKFALGVDIREYELTGNLDGRRYQDVYVVNPDTGERKLALRKAAHVMAESPDGTRFLYYNDGVFFAYDMEGGKSTELTKQIPSTFWDTEDDHNVVKPPTQSFGWTKDSSAVLLSDGWDIWKVPVDGGKAENLTLNGKKDKIRYKRPFRLDPEEKGIDFSAPVYVPVYGEWTKKGGIGVIEPGKPGIRMLQWDDAAFTQLIKAKKADTYLYTRETTKEYPDFYVADASLAHGQKVTDANPQQKDFLWSSGVRLVDYTSTRGEKLQAAMWLPAGYEAGKKYPMLVYIYEKESQVANNYPQPGYNGFNIAHYTSNGYAVLEPDIVYKVNDPGMSAVACVVPAVKAAIGTGVVDPQKVGIQGHSWGGYQTAFLVTQTDIFHAAVAGAPLTDMVGMYSLIYRNTGGANQAIFESSQGRFKGGYWDNMEAYIRNSPVYHATNVHTPLMILHNDKDGAVDQTQGIEYFNTLRRLGKPVILLEYKGENHGLAKPENMKDYTIRMREFFDHYLMDKPAPKWMEDGIPLLQMKEHLEEVTKTLTPPAERN